MNTIHPGALVQTRQPDDELHADTVIALWKEPYDDSVLWSNKLMGWAEIDAVGLCLARVDDNMLVLFGETLGWNDADKFSPVGDRIPT